MSDTSGKAASAVSRLGLDPGDIVGEVGYDDDVDETLRKAIETAVETELLDGSADEVFDAVLAWWRAEDGDLTDELVDVTTVLAEDGVVLLATPRPGFSGFVDAAEINDAADTAGLGRPSSGQPVGDWVIAKLTRSKLPSKTRR